MIDNKHIYLLVDVCFFLNNENLFLNLNKDSKGFVPFVIVCDLCMSHMACAEYTIQCLHLHFRLKIVQIL